MDDETLPTGQTAIPADRIDDLGIHTFAHCMWWVDKGEDLPTDPLQRNALWQDECALWVYTARQVLLHMEYNNLILKRRD